MINNYFEPIMPEKSAIAATAKSPNTSRGGLLHSTRHRSLNFRLPIHHIWFIIPLNLLINMKDVLAIILAGGKGNRLSVLSEKRAKPAVPFAGRYRLIDFTLSNCVNSGIYDVAVLTQYRPRSLSKHIGIGRPWDLDRKTGGVEILQPYLGRAESGWYKGTADAVYRNHRYIETRDFENVLILSGDHVYSMDYREMLRFHRERQADLTIACMQVPIEDASRFGIMSLGGDGYIHRFEEKPNDPKSDMASMGIYIFTKHVLRDVLRQVP